MTAGRHARALTVWLVFIASAAVAVAQAVPDPELSSSETRVRQKISAFRQVVVDDLSNSEAWGRYGMVLEAHRLLEDAAVCYRRAHELDRKVFSWPYFLAVLLEYQDPRQGEPWCRKAIAIDPGYAPAHVRLGETLEKLGDWAQAKEQFEQARKLDPSDPLGHFGLGRAALAADELAAAISHLERARELAPDIQSIVATLARAYQRNGDADRARELARAARSLPRMTHHRDPRRTQIRDEAVNIESYLLRSRTYQEVGQLDRALHELDLLFEVDPGHAEGHLLAAGLHDRRGDPSAAVAAAERALDLDPDLAGARAVLAGALFKLSRFERAHQEATRVLAKEPRNFHMLMLESLLAGQRGDVGAWLTNLDRAFAARTADRDLRRLLRDLLLDQAHTLGEINKRDDVARRLEQALQLAVEEGAPSAEIDGYRRQLEAIRASSPR